MIYLYIYIYIYIYIYLYIHFFYFSFFSIFYIYTCSDLEARSRITGKSMGGVQALSKPIKNWCTAVTILTNFLEGDGGSECTISRKYKYLDIYKNI
jgi:hypothetical protein